MVETRALRRSDDIKTAVLRSVSHDLRSPLTAIVTAGEALSSPALEAASESRWRTRSATRAERLSRLVDQLIDLSRLQAGAAEPRADWTSLDEVIRAAVEDTGAPPERVKLAIAPDLPLIRADATQLRRAIANLIENALRYGGDHPVSVRTRVSGGRDPDARRRPGPGHPGGRAGADLPAVLAADGEGSGLGLAIVRGFVEANGGHVRVESLPGQGTSFVIDLPLPATAPVPA